VRIVIVGAGATGSLFGARLARAGESVLLIGRAEHVAAIRARGLVVEGLDPGTFRLDAASQLEPGTSAEAALLTVKSFDLGAAARSLGDATPPLPTALLGNGLGIEGVALRAFSDAGWPAPERSVVRAIHTVPATFLGPGRVRASGVGEIVLPAPSADSPAAPATAVLAELFSRAGFVVHRSLEFDREVWRKALINAAINPVTALRRIPNGLLHSGEARAEAELLLGEALAVARRSGVELEFSVAVSDLDRVVRATAENRSSMLQDVERGRPTEIDSISGEVLRRGRALGLDLPATARVVAALAPAEGAGRAPAKR
jgi:2-dehydropantoate 2-reductase